MTLNEIFHKKKTENGDVAFDVVSTDDNLLNILFFSEYYQKHLDEVYIGTSERDQLFARFIRDPRFGLGLRDLGRVLMKESGCSVNDIVKSGRVDDLFVLFLFDPNTGDYILNKDVLDFLYKEIVSGNELVKKWMPRYSSKNLLIARAISKYWGMNKQTYGKFIKCDSTVEYKLAHKSVDDIIFEHVPSLAMIKYYTRFSTKDDTKERFNKFIEDVKSGKKELKVSTTTVYDIYRNMDKIDPDLFFSKMEKISINALPIIDTSGSMFGTANDAIGKALSIGHYLSKCSTFAPDKVVTFSSNPQLITLGNPVANFRNIAYTVGWYPEMKKRFGFVFDKESEQDVVPGSIDEIDSQYKRELLSMITGDVSNTDFGKVMELFKDLTEVPEYLVVMSDMEFDAGSRNSKEELREIWKRKGYMTKIIWWNLNSRNTTAPEMDHDGNIFMSGYSPMLLKFLQCGFDGQMFLNSLLEGYKKEIE